MGLKRRQAYLLQRLTQNNNLIDIDAYLTEVRVSMRTLYYDIEKINDWLNSYCLGEIGLEKKNIYAQLHDMTKTRKKLGEIPSYFFMADERQAMTVLMVSLFHEQITIQSLMEYFDVSKNTVLTDLKSIREFFSSEGIELLNDYKKGYYISGDERIIRKILWAQFRILSNDSGVVAIKKLLQDTMVRITGNEIDFLELGRSLIKQYERDIKGEFFLDEKHMESMMVQASIIRSWKDNEIIMNQDEKFALMKTLSYRSVAHSSKKLAHLGMGIPDEETYYITSLLLGMQTANFTTQEQEDTFISKLSESLIYHFECIACIVFPDRELLKTQLEHHIRPMYYRLKYGITDKNPLCEDIKRMYPVVFDFAKRALMQIDNALIKAITDDELAYLCIYLATNLNEKYISKENSVLQEKILIIAGSNMATATFVKEQLQELLGCDFQFNVITNDSLRKWELKDYVLIISLVALPAHIQSSRIVNVGAVLTKRDQSKIISILSKDEKVEKRDKLIGGIIELVEKSTGADVNKSQLYVDLFKYFNAFEKKEDHEERRESFFEKMRMDKFLVIHQSKNWKDAIYEGALSLQGDRLKSKMSNLIQKEKLQYYRLHKDVALVHYPMQGEKEATIDIRLLKREDELEFIDHMPVKIIICFSTVDLYSHWELLQEIYQYFSIEDHVQGMVNLLELGESHGEANELFMV